MSKYDAIFYSEETIDEELSPEEGLMHIAMMAVSADGEFPEDEIESIYGVISNTPPFEDYTDEEALERCREILLNVSNLTKEYGKGPVFNAAIDAFEEDETLLEAAYAVAVELCVVDGELPEKEEEFLAALQEALEISDEVAEEIFAELTDP